MSNEQHIASIVELGKDNNFALPPPMLPVVALECQPCGFVRMHSLFHVANWKLSKAT